MTANAISTEAAGHGSLRRGKSVLVVLGVVVLFVVAVWLLAGFWVERSESRNTLRLVLSSAVASGTTIRDALDEQERRHGGAKFLCRAGQWTVRCKLESAAGGVQYAWYSSGERVFPLTRVTESLYPPGSLDLVELEKVREMYCMSSTTTEEPCDRRSSPARK